MNLFKKGFRKIARLERRMPDAKHDTRYLECGHSVIVPRATLHPVRSKCIECENNLGAALSTPCSLNDPA